MYLCYIQSIVGYRSIVFRRVFLIMTVLYLWRSVTMMVTQVPVASSTYYCSPQANHTTVLLVVQRVFRLMSGMGLSINGQHVYCGDFIYSGHTVILTMSYLTFKEYAPAWCRVVNAIFAILSAIAVILIVVARGHYTVDVVIAYFVTTRVFWAYHTLANNPSLKVAGPTNYLANAWWFRIFQYFERNVLEPVPREYSWPLPWPSRGGPFRTL
ncbi:SGMS1, partial [Cordylochernes scorpioides]